MQRSSHPKLTDTGGCRTREIAARGLLLPIPALCAPMLGVAVQASAESPPAESSLSLGLDYWSDYFWRGASG